MQNSDKTPQELRKEEVERLKNQPGNNAFIVSRKRKLLNLLFLVISGAFASLMFPPHNFHITAWISIIPLFYIIRNMQKWEALRAGFIWAFSWHFCSFFWIREIEFVLPFVLAAILASFNAVWAMAVPCIKQYIFIPVKVQLQGYEEMEKYVDISHKKQIIFTVVISALWCFIEWVRSWFATGMPWNFLAASQWQNISLIQIVEYTGMYGVSFIIIFFNIALALAFDGWKQGFKQGRYKRPVTLIIAFGLIVLTSLTYSKRLIKDTKAEKIPLRASVIQGNIKQCRIPKEGEAENALNTYMGLSSLAVITKPDIVIWSETAVPVFYRDANHPVARDYRNRLTGLIDKTKIPFLIGTIDFFFQKDSKDALIFNSAMLIGKDGQIKDKYDKEHRVPFGEYIPLRSLLPNFFVNMVDMGRDLTPGNKFNPLEIKKDVFAGISICFEDVFPYISREACKNGANVLVVITNDAWYPESSESEQHLANSIFRAVENQRYLIRCGNDSNSVLINPDGSISPDNMITKPKEKGSGFANFEIEVLKNPKLTFYTKYGEIFILICFIICLFAQVAIFMKWREKRASLID